MIGEPTIRFTSSYCLIKMKRTDLYITNYWTELNCHANFLSLHRADCKTRIASAQLHLVPSPFVFDRYAHWRELDFH
jgi:hypothetical protein